MPAGSTQIRGGRVPGNSLELRCRRIAHWTISVSLMSGPSPAEKIPDYPRDKKTLELFRKATGHSPESNPKAWNKWRTQQVTALVSDVKRMMETTRPEAVLSAAVSARPHQSTNPHFQDGREWVRKGYLDKVFLMNYTSDVDTFSERIDPWLRSTAISP